MKYSLPRPSVPALLIQCSIMVLFGLSLFLFISALKSGKNYEEAILQLSHKEQRLSRAGEQLDSYLSYVAVEPYFQRNGEEPQWEKIDEVWEDLSYETLLRRLAALYKPERPFVLDFFSANLKSGGAENGPPAPGVSSAGSTITGKKRDNTLVFNLQGYFLCPCR